MAEKIVSPGIFIGENDKSIISKGPNIVGAALVGPTVKGAPLIPTIVTSYSEYISKFGETFKSGSNYYEYFTSLTAKEYFSGGGKSLLVTRIISGSNYNTYATAYVNSSGSNLSQIENSSIILECIHYGNIMNNTSSLSSTGILNSGSVDNIRWEVSDVDYSKGTFNLLIRKGDDNHQNKNILESFSNLSLDPSQPNYISRVIGDKKDIYNPDTGDGAYVSSIGTYDLSSKYVRVKSVITPNVDSLDNNGNFKTSYAYTLPALGSGSFGGSFNGGVAPTNRSALLNDNITSSATNTQGYIASDYEIALSLLENKEEYDFNLLFTPGLFLSGHSNIVSDNNISTAEGREDCFSIVDVPFGSSKVDAVNASAGSNSNYAGLYYPWVQTFSTNLGRPVWVPPSVVMAGVYSFNDEVENVWAAPAGMGRGGINSIINIERKLSQSDRNYLYQNNVNPLASFPNEGVVAFGQKTLQKRDTSLNRINVRRLMIDIKRYAKNICQNLLFEPNTTVTRNKFITNMNPYLERIVQNNGLYAFQVKMDETNNTSDIIDRNQLVGQITVQPTKSIEFIILDFTITPSGVTFS